MGEPNITNGIFLETLNRQVISGFTIIDQIQDATHFAAIICPRVALKPEFQQEQGYGSGIPLSNFENLVTLYSLELLQEQFVNKIIALFDKFSYQYMPFEVVNGKDELHDCCFNYI